MKNSIQPLVTDDNGVLRFKENKIVTYLLEHGGIDMNTIARGDFTKEDAQHFAQLIGYSFSGWSTLSWVSDEDYQAVKTMMEEDINPYKARLDYLENLLSNLRENLKTPIAELYGIHEGNLEN